MKPKKAKKVPTKVKEEVCVECGGINTCLGMRCTGPAEVEADRYDFPETDFR